jgi:hypothetical protein
MCWSELIFKNWSCGARAGYDVQQYHGSTFQSHKCVDFRRWQQAYSNCHTLRPHLLGVITLLALFGCVAMEQQRPFAGQHQPHDPGQYPLTLQI